MERQQILFAPKSVCVGKARWVCSQETGFDKLIRFKHPDGNMPTGCISRNDFAFQLHPVDQAAGAREIRKRIRPTPGFRCLRHPLSKSFSYLNDSLMLSF